MAEEQKTTTEIPSETPPPPLPAPVPEAESPVVVEASKDVPEEKSVVPIEEYKTDDSKAIVAVEKPVESVEEKESTGSVNRDAVLTRVETEKRLTLITAWEESEKCKAENKAQRKLSFVGSWEKSRKASVEAELQKIEEKLEKKKAQYIEKLKNKEALIHKTAEEKKAMIEAKRGEDLLKAEETAAKYRATGNAPKKPLFGYF